MKVTLPRFLQSHWLSRQGAEPEGGKDWGWRCTFPPNNRAGAKQTFLRQTNTLKQQRSCCHSITTPGQNLLCFYCPGFSRQLFMYFLCHPKSPPLLQHFYCIPISRHRQSFMCKTHWGWNKGNSPRPRLQGCLQPQPPLWHSAPTKGGRTPRSHLNCW